MTHGYRLGRYYAAMPLSWTEGQMPSAHQQVVCPAHGIIMMGPKENRELLNDAVVEHFLSEHDGEAVIVEGQDFTIEDAPMRCDICGTVAEPPWWTYAAEPRVIDPGDADGLWLVCDPCDEIIQSGRNVTVRICTRAVREQRRQSPIIPRDMIFDAVSEHITTFVQVASRRGRDSDPN